MVTFIYYLEHMFHIMGKIDKKDKLVLEVLKDHAEYTTRQIARKTKLPITTVHNRIRKLRADGVIKKFTVELDHNKVDSGFLVYVIIKVNLLQLKQKQKTQYDVAAAVRKFPFVERVDIVSGGGDLVAMVRVKDVSEYDDVLLTKLQLIEGIENTQSLIVLSGC